MRKCGCKAKAKGKPQSKPKGKPKPTSKAKVSNKIEQGRIMYNFEYEISHNKSQIKKYARLYPL